MSRSIRLVIVLVLMQLPVAHSWSQTHPAITSWLINTTGITGRHYLEGNPTPIIDTAKANVQLVRYSADFAYVNSSGIPAYVIGPYRDGNPSIAVNRNYLFKIPLSPSIQTGSKTTVGLGHIGVLINGVPIYNYADARSYNNQNVWHQNAVHFERTGFDCAVGHPAPLQTGPPGMGGGGSAQGQYHHHQNPTAFNIANVKMSDVCDMYLADGLYVPDSTTHGPLIGFAFDGYPIYGAYGWENGSQTVKRITSSYRLRAITERTSLADGTVLTAAQTGPTIEQTPLGAYAEDFEYVPGSGDLDEHNGRFCQTPEYPQGTYAYFATIDVNGVSTYPYVIGPTYYGIVAADNFPVRGPGAGSTNVTIAEPVSVYAPTTAFTESDAHDLQPDVTVYPNPSHDVIIVQITQPLSVSAQVDLVDLSGRIVKQAVINQGSTMCFVDVQTIYAGAYVVRISHRDATLRYSIVIGE